MIKNRKSGVKERMSLAKNNDESLLILTGDRSVSSDENLISLLKQSGYKIVKIAITKGTMDEGENKPADPVSCLMRKRYRDESSKKNMENTIKDLVPLYSQESDYCRDLIRRAAAAAVGCATQMPVEQLKMELKHLNGDMDTIPVRLHTVFGCLPPSDMSIEYDSDMLHMGIDSEAKAIHKERIQAPWDPYSAFDVSTVFYSKIFLNSASNYCSEYGIDALSVCEAMRKEKTCCIVRIEDDSKESRFVTDTFLTDFMKSAMKNRILDPEQNILMLFDKMDNFCISGLEDRMSVAKAYKLEMECF